MPTSYEDKILDQAHQYLDPDEHAVAAFIARPRGATTAGAGGIAPGWLGGRKIKQQQRYAQNAGLRLSNPMALALTDRRLLVLSVSPPLALGKGGDVKELVSTVPLSEVESIEVKRLLVGKSVTVVAGGASFKLEANATANAQGLAEEFIRVKAGASPVGPRRPGR
jgi:hypothetical protein